MALATQYASKLLLAFTNIFLRRLPSPLSLLRRNAHAPPHVKLQKRPCPEKFAGQTLVFDVEGALLRSSSTFPYFMLVAMEAGGLLRALLLLLLYPLVCCLGEEVGFRAMVFVCFCGIKMGGFRVGRTVLPKHFLEDVGLEGFEVLMSGKKKVCVSSMPTVIVEGFLKDYLGAEVVMGRKLKVVCGFYTGLMMDGEESEGLVVLKELLREEKEKETGVGVLGIGGYSKGLQHTFFTHLKEVHTVSEAEKRDWHPLPRERYPKPLIFHDGRVAFRPTPFAALAMFIWLPFGFLLAIFRTLVFISLPYNLSIPSLAFSGFKGRLIRSNLPSPPIEEDGTRPNKHRLFVCNHRTLLDPLIVSAALGKHVTAVTYSVSRISELTSPIKTVRLTRNREDDRKTMEKHLSQGDLVVCPEGTTCREPFLLRFSALFAELTDEFFPVALDSSVSMFYGTTASGFKFLDPLYFLTNPFPYYAVEFLGKVSASCGDGCKGSSYEMANLAQRETGKALGFRCTGLTRKDKYLMLAGHDGAVRSRRRRPDGRRRSFSANNEGGAKGNRCVCSMGNGDAATHRSNSFEIITEY